MTGDPTYDPLKEQALRQGLFTNIPQVRTTQQRPIELGNGWKPYNSALEAGYMMSFLADMLTTRQGMVDQGRGESNPIAKLLIGKPSNAKFGLLTAAGLAYHPLVSYYLLNEPYRTIFQALTTLGHGLSANQNVNVGLKIGL